MNTTDRSVGMALFAVVVIVVIAAIGAALEIGVIGVSHAQEEEQSPFISPLIPFAPPPPPPPSSSPSHLVSYHQN
jgi:hypothetical protein